MCDSELDSWKCMWRMVLNSWFCFCGWRSRPDSESRLQPPDLHYKVYAAYSLDYNHTIIQTLAYSLRSKGCDMIKISIILAKLQNEQDAQHKWHTNIMHMWMQPTRVEGNRRMRTGVWGNDWGNLVLNCTCGQHKLIGGCSAISRMTGVCKNITSNRHNECNWRQQKKKNEVYRRSW